jgi:hypothetical protein
MRLRFYYDLTRSAALDRIETRTSRESENEPFRSLEKAESGTSQATVRSMIATASSRLSLKIAAPSIGEATILGILGILVDHFRSPLFNQTFTLEKSSYRNRFRSAFRFICSLLVA